MEFLKNAVVAQPPKQEEPAMTEDIANNIWEEKARLEVLEHYSVDEKIPVEMIKDNWGIYGKALTLTFLEEKDLAMIDIYNQITRINALTCKPAHLMDFGKVNMLDQTGLYFFLTAKRAIGTNREKMNERTLQNTQTVQNISSQGDGTTGKPKGGFFSRLLRAV